MTAPSLASSTSSPQEAAYRFGTISVFGLGYVGLPTASVLATKGFRVIGVDVNPAVVETVNRGDIHITEPDLDVLVRSAVQSGNLVATVRPQAADAFVIAVPTPFKEGHKPDLTYVKAATESLAPVLQAGNLVVLESTSPVGTTEQIADWIAARRPDLVVPRRGVPVGSNDPNRIYVAHCPERVLPGQVLRELVLNDRVVGGVDPASTDRARALYKTFVSGRVLTTDARTAEMTKLTENAFRDVNIAFANEVATIAEKLGVDPWELIELANHHPRVKILRPGPGVGGHCVAVDPWFLVDAAPTESRLLRAAREVNDSRPRRVVDRVRHELQSRPRAAVACLGLSYKADIDDLRESPALHIAEELAAAGMTLNVVEPHVRNLPASLHGRPKVRLVDLERALAESEIVLLLVDHRAFKAVDRARLAGKTVIDTRGVWR